MDNRGDGSWVRAAMDAIPDLAAAAQAAGGGETSGTLRPDRARGCLRAPEAAAEKIDRVRAAAGAAPRVVLRGGGARARASAAFPRGRRCWRRFPSRRVGTWRRVAAFPALARLVAAGDELA